MIKQGYLALLFFMVRQYTCQFSHILLTQRNGDRDFMMERRLTISFRLCHLEHQPNRYHILLKRVYEYLISSHLQPDIIIFHSLMSEKTKV